MKKKRDLINASKNSYSNPSPSEPERIPVKSLNAFGILFPRISLILLLIWEWEQMRRHRVEEMNCSLASGNGVLVVNEVTALFGEWSQPQSRLGSIVISQCLSWLIRWYLKKSETTRFPYRRRKGFLLLLGGSNQGTKKLFSHGSLIRSYLTILLSFFITGQKHNADLWTKEGIRKFIMT